MNRRRQFGAAVLVAGVALLLGGAGQARAAFVITIFQNGPNVEADGSGSLNLTGLHQAASANGNVPSVFAAVGFVKIGDPSRNSTTPEWATISGSGTFGGGGLFSASSGTGLLIGVDVSGLGGKALAVDSGYTSGTSITDSSTWNNTTINGPGGLGLTPGTYTWTWTIPAVVGPDTPPPTTDSITVNIVSSVPAPPSVIPLLTGALGLLGYGWRRRRQAAA
jgi:MYXO-CTERM domain-containing protein